MSDDLTIVAQKAARGGLFLFVGNGSSQVIQAVGILIVARLLTPSNYGLYTLALAIPILLASFSDIGMNFALVRLPAKLRAQGDYAGANRLIRLGFLIKLGISILAFLICYFGSSSIATTLLNRPELAPLLRLASPMIVFQAIFDATNNSFIGQDLMQYAASVQITQAILKGSLGPLLVLTGLGIGGALLGYVLSLTVAGLAGALMLLAKRTRVMVKVVIPTDAMFMPGHCRRSNRAPYLGQDEGSRLKGLRALLSYGLPLYVAAILTIFLSQYQNIVLAHFSSDIEIGNFSATGNFAQFMMILVYPITTAIFPMFSKMDTRNQRSDLARGFVLAVKYTSLLMIPASLAVMIFSRDLIYLTYGSGYTLASQYLVLFSALYLLTAISYLVLGSFLNGVAETRTVFEISVLTLALYLPLGPALTWLWGPYGLLVGYFLANAISTVYGIRVTSAKFNARPDLKSSGRILIAALGAAIPTVGLIQLDPARVGVVNLIVGGLFYLLVYLTLAPILRAVDNQDILNVRTLLGETPLVSKLLDPVLRYESRLLTLTRHD
jgi:O-antigen/teichoic acid export membrane protein